MGRSTLIVIVLGNGTDKNASSQSPMHPAELHCDISEAVN